MNKDEKLALLDKAEKQTAQLLVTLSDLSDNMNSDNIESSYTYLVNEIIPSLRLEKDSHEDTGSYKRTVEYFDGVLVGRTL